jgi:hypothetical protein
MQICRLLVCSLLSFSLLLPAAGQQASLQAAQLLKQTLGALGATSPITDITLSGTAHYIAGSDDETGTATLKAIPGASRIDLNLSSGPRIEIENITGAAPAGSRSGPDGVVHSISDHNLLTDPGWFFPSFPITHGLSSGYAAIYVGHETRDGQAVEHVTISQTASIRTLKGAPTMAHLSQMHFFLDSTTFLPAAVTFDIHPDDDASLDIPIEIRFSDYRSVNGVQVPFHVERFLNNGLVLNLQFDTAVLNTGLNASNFQVQ